MHDPDDKQILIDEPIPGGSHLYAFEVSSPTGSGRMAVVAMFLTDGPDRHVGPRLTMHSAEHADNASMRHVSWSDGESPSPLKIGIVNGGRPVLLVTAPGETPGTGRVVQFDLVDLEAMALAKLASPGVVTIPASDDAIRQIRLLHPDDPSAN